MTRRAERAVVRRVSLVGGTVLALTCALWQESELYRIEAVDFASGQQVEPGRTGRRQQSLEDYLEPRTKGRVLEKSGQVWRDLYREVEMAGPNRFFLPDWAPLHELAGAFDGTFTYIALRDAGRTRCLSVTAWRPGDSPAPPDRLRYPWRRFDALIFLTGLLGYALVPWPRRYPHLVAYSRTTTALLPDLLVGMPLVGVFYTLPWLVVPAQAHMSHPVVVEGGWIVLTAVMWGLTLLSMAIHAVAAWYEALCLDVAGDHLVVESLGGTERIDFADIEAVDLGLRTSPRFLVCLLNRRALGPILTMAGRRGRVMEIVLWNGRCRRFRLTGAYHLDHLVAALGQAGVTVDPQLVRSSLRPKSAAR